MSESLVIEVVRKVVTVDCAVEEAFRVFTEDAMSWWPVATHSIHETVREIVFEPREGGEVYEVSTAGEKGHWATVTGWDPPARLVLAWNILERPGEQTEVEVRFTPEGDGTRVELEHRGWEAVAEGAAEKRADYDTGWGHVLGRYEARL
ncbi:MAG TPA: SRPBCC family protein [Gaiellaceae bacterium]|jgi:uncharacterized protein YndB with AHSA1/START domain|nr:SRPBCC family protein [Gaiellaceae bacterium]